MAALYANENFPLPVVEALRGLGHDVWTTQDRGMSGQAIPDPEVLKYAVQNGRTLITLNRFHFIGLHPRMPDHQGIIVCTLDRDFESLAQRIHDQLDAAKNLTGQLIRINRPG